MQITVKRSKLESSVSQEELLKLKSKFRAAAYQNKDYDFGSLFDKLDSDGSGSLDIKEFAEAVKKFLPLIKRQHLKALLAAADEDGSGTIERGEFIAFIGSDTTTLRRLSKLQAVNVYEKISCFKTACDDNEELSNKYIPWDWSINPNIPPKYPKKSNRKSNTINAEMFSEEEFVAYEITPDKTEIEIPVIVNKLSRRSKPTEKELESGPLEGENIGTNYIHTKFVNIPLIDIKSWWVGVQQKKKMAEESASNQMMGKLHR